MLARQYKPVQVSNLIVHQGIALMYDFIFGSIRLYNVGIAIVFRSFES